MKYLGIDYGTKRIGVAVSDDNGSIAFPYAVVKTGTDALDKIIAIITSEKITTVVVGLSTNAAGIENTVQKDISIFADALRQKIPVEILFQKEFMTSSEAHGRQGKERFNARPSFFSKPKDLDASAAALILQRFLDRNKKKDSFA